MTDDNQESCAEPVSEMPASHRRQIDDGLRQSLLKAGVPRPFHDRSIRDVEGGNAVADWILSEGKKRVHTGGGFTLYASGRKASELMILSARVYHMNGVGSLFLDSVRLVKAITERDDAFLERIENARALFVYRFYFADGRDDQPFTGYQRAAVESLLLKRWNRGAACFLNFNKRHDGRGSPWWRSDFLDAMDSYNATLAVA